MLPEGEKEAADALVQFAEDDRNQQLLGRGKTSFDLRVPERMFVCCKAKPTPTPAPEGGNIVVGNITGQE
jgi:hypothetical protein